MPAIFAGVIGSIASCGLKVLPRSSKICVSLFFGRIHVQEHRLGHQTCFTQAYLDLVDRLTVIGTHVFVILAVRRGYLGHGVRLRGNTASLDFCNHSLVLSYLADSITITAWIAYARKRDRLAGVLTTFTFLPVLVLILIIILANFFYWFRLSYTGLF